LSAKFDTRNIQRAVFICDCLHVVKPAELVAFTVLCPNDLAQATVSIRNAMEDGTQKLRVLVFIRLRYPQVRHLIAGLSENLKSHVHRERVRLDECREFLCVNLSRPIHVNRIEQFTKLRRSENSCVKPAVVPNYE
jgi:hypothetical protein